MDPADRPTPPRQGRPPKAWVLRLLVGLLFFAAAVAVVRLRLPRDEDSTLFFLCMAAVLLPFCLLAGTGVVKVIQDMAGNAERSRLYLERHGRPAPSWIEKQFIKTPGWIIILLALIFNGGAVIVGLTGLVICKERLARRRARRLLMVGGAVVLIGMALYAALVIYAIRNSA